MTQGPRQRCDRPFRRAAGFLVTVMVQTISRIPPTSSDSLVTITPPVIGIQDESQQARWTRWLRRCRVGRVREQAAMAAAREEIERLRATVTEQAVVIHVADGKARLGRVS